MLVDGGNEKLKNTNFDAEPEWKFGYLIFYFAMLIKSNISVTQK